MKEEQGQHQNEETETSSSGIFSLNPECEKRLHSHALKRFNDWKTEIFHEVPQLEQLTIDEFNADINTYLNDEERVRAAKYRDNVAEWLGKCIDIGNGYSRYSPAYDTSVISDMSGLKSLIKKTYKVRAEKLASERKEREDSERWRAAYIAIKPPDDDAKKYLNDNEYEKFKRATWKVIDVYMEKGEDYLYDIGTFDYRWCLKKINDRKETERRQITANWGAHEYNQRLNKEKARLKALLYPNRKDHESYFKKQIKDRRYKGQSFAEFLSSEEKQGFDKTIVDIGRKKLDEIVSSDFRQFIDEECWRSYLLLPSVEYRLEEVPCLDFMFDVFAVVETRVWLKPGQKTFCGYIFNLPWRDEKGYSILLQEREFLGYYYAVLLPEDLGGYVFWQSIPLVLIKGLLSGETKPNGATISAASDGMITYKIPKFIKEVTIPDSFAGYLKSIGSIDEMVSMGIMTDKVTDIVKSESGELEVEQKPSLSEEKGRDSKKARAFQLFDQGKGPSSPEVKALGLHKSNRFRYYNQYLAVHKP